MSNIICQITWTEEDLRNAFFEKYNRFPTQEELYACIHNLNCSNLQDRSIEFGWDFIHNAVAKTAIIS